MMMMMMLLLLLLLGGDDEEDEDARAHARPVAGAGSALDDVHFAASDVED